uniref:Leucyl/phenylalanyl-tRNA--protein transferase (L/F-transferase) (Leucyltransferase) (Phenyalanyltransferase) n=1 Tax=mine drainage metagenome TaxID=410659 RepID=E6QTF2_9ZZZZ
MLPWLITPADFPPVEQALDAPAGLLAAGGGLTADWLLAAYRRGVFPWFSPGQPILWWSPNPRMVLFPEQLHVPHSLMRTVRKEKFEIRLNTAFVEVMRACAAPRVGETGTWISEEMIKAYTALHEQGMAHSIEAWLGGNLVGGLYGVALGKVFFGESMFARVSDASKVAFVKGVHQLQRLGVVMIDCQMNTPHLARFGAIEISREDFLCRLETGINQTTPVWRFDKVSVA